MPLHCKVNPSSPTTNLQKVGYTFFSSPAQAIFSEAAYHSLLRYCKHPLIPVFYKLTI